MKLPTTMMASALEGSPAREERGRRVRPARRKPPGSAKQVFVLILAIGAAVVNAVSVLSGELVKMVRPGKVVWSGDAETGNLSQWASAVMVAPDRIRAVTTPVSEGRYAYRFEVRQGDDPVPAFSSNDRAELSQANPGNGPL